MILTDKPDARTAVAAPFYKPVGDEVEVFRAAARRGLPVLLEGPTGCGKTRFVVAHEAGTAHDTAPALVTPGNAIRNLDGAPLREVASTRMLTLAGGLVAEGLSLRSAVRSAVVQALSDDQEVIRALGELADAVLPGS